MVTAMALASVVIGCSSSDDSPTPRPSGGSGQTSSGLSLAFSSKCARCHGTTATGQGIYPALPGSLTAAEYSATVRSGRKQMPSFDTGQITDADIAVDYTWLTTKR